jgi:midasin (ATPase involved in ribosome maturation)
VVSACDPSDGRLIQYAAPSPVDCPVKVADVESGWWTAGSPLIMVDVESAITVTPAELPHVLLHVAVTRPVFVWGAPGIGKSSIVRAFAESLGLHCVTLVGTQLAAEDIIGVPELRNGRSRFAPPELIARDEPYCLFLDELN